MTINKYVYAKQLHDFRLNSLTGLGKTERISIPDSIDVSNELFTLTVNNLEVEDARVLSINFKANIDIYLYGIKQPDDRYTTTYDGQTLTIQFNTQITRLPNEVAKEDFEIIGLFEVQ